MKRMMNKIRRIRTTRWSKLTTGEKILSTIGTLLKWAVIIAIIVTVASTVFAAVVGIMIAVGIGNAIAGGFADASRAYRPGDQYIRFR